MTAIKQVQARMDVLANLMAEKGLRLPRALFHVGGHEGNRVVLHWAKTPESFYSDDIKVFNDEFPIEDAYTWVQNLPMPESKAQQDYLEMLAKAVDFGHANNIQSEYVDPVRITQKAVRRNILTNEARHDDL